MATMPSFLVCKYFSDPRRQEAKNVGVILLHPDGVTARFIGEDMPGDIDGRRVKPLILDTKGYEQWVQYWRYCTEEVSHKPASERIYSQLRQVLLESSKSNYVVVDGGTVVLPSAEDKDPTALLSYVYNEIVEAEPEAAPAEKIDLERRTSQVIIDSGISKKPLFDSSPKIEVLNRKGIKEKLQPSYLYIGKNYNIIETIPLHGSSEKAAQRAVDATQYMYEKLENHAKHQNRKEAVFASVIDARPERYTYDVDEIIRILGSWGPVVNIADITGAVKTLEHIAQA